jgi:hypothetical protein
MTKWGTDFSLGTQLQHHPHITESRSKSADYTPLGAVHRVLQQHRHGHRPDASGDRSQVTRDLARLREIHIANESVPRLPGWVVDGVCPDVDDRRAWFDPVSLDLTAKRTQQSELRQQHKIGWAYRRRIMYHHGLASCCNDNVCLTDNCFGIWGP